MKEKTSCNNYSENKSNEADVSVDPADADIPDKNLLTDHSDRKKKTWCSYMENEFRKTRNIFENKVESEQLPDLNMQKTDR